MRGNASRPDPHIDGGRTESLEGSLQDVGTSREAIDQKLTLRIRDDRAHGAAGPVFQIDPCARQYRAGLVFDRPTHCLGLDGLTLRTAKQEEEDQSRHSRTVTNRT